MSKTINGLIIGISVFLVIVLIIVSILMFPLKGKTYDYDYWYRDKPYDINDTIVLEKEENKDFYYYRFAIQRCFRFVRKSR